MELEEALKLAVIIDEKREASLTETALGCVPQVGCLFSLLFFGSNLLRSSGPPPPVIKVRVPQCRECAPSGMPSVRNVSFETDTLVLDVHPRFADWAEQASRGSSAERPPDRGSER